MPTIYDASHALYRSQRRGWDESLQPPYDWQDCVRWADRRPRLDATPTRGVNSLELDADGVPIPLPSDRLTSPADYARCTSAADASGATRWSAAWLAAWVAERYGRQLVRVEVARCSDGGVVCGLEVYGSP